MEKKKRGQKEKKRTKVYYRVSVKILGVRERNQGGSQRKINFKVTKMVRGGRKNGGETNRSYKEKVRQTVKPIKRED